MEHFECGCCGKGACEVIVCDGYSGNILLKSIEGTASFIFSEMKNIMYKNVKTKLGALLIKKSLYGLKDKLSADKVGGTMLLGISKPVIKAHGSSNAEAIRYAIRQAKAAAESDMIAAVASALQAE